jgi:hypothetical protein
MMTVLRQMMIVQLSETLTKNNTATEGLPAQEEDANQQLEMSLEKIIATNAYQVINLEIFALQQANKLLVNNLSAIGTQDHEHAQEQAVRIEIQLI